MTRLLVAQSGGCTAVINSSLVGVVDEALASRASRPSTGRASASAASLDGDFVDLGRQSRATLDRVRRTPSAALGSARYKLSDDECAARARYAGRHGIGIFLLIGGNDSADTAHRLGRLATERGAGPARGGRAQDHRQRPARDRSLPRLRQRRALPGAVYARWRARRRGDAPLGPRQGRRGDGPRRRLAGRGHGAGRARRARRAAPDLRPRAPLRPRTRSWRTCARPTRGWATAWPSSPRRCATRRAGRSGGLDGPPPVDAFGHPVIAGTAAALCAAPSARSWA